MSKLSEKWAIKFKNEWLVAKMDGIIKWYEEELENGKRMGLNG